MRRFTFTALLFNFVFVAATGAQFSGGDGSYSLPFKISSLEQLDDIRSWLSSSFVLTTDLDFAGSRFDLARSEQHKGWDPIRNFSGMFNGQGHVIKNLYINRPDENAVGLFGGCDSLLNFNSGHRAKLYGVGIVDCRVIGKKYVGALIGCDKVMVEQCFATGSVTGIEIVGGLAGWISCTMECYSAASVTGKSCVGGLVAKCSDVSDCYSTGIVISNYKLTGGLTDCNCNEYISYRSYSISPVLFSCSKSNKPVDSHCPSYRDIQASRIKNLYWGIGKTTAEMKSQATYKHWLFDAHWGIREGESYPGLSELENYPVAEHRLCTTAINQSIDIALAASDVAGNAIAGYTIATRPRYGTLTQTGQTVQYTPAKDNNREDSFTYFATDAMGRKSNRAIVVITIKKGATR